MLQPLTTRAGPCATSLALVPAKYALFGRCAQLGGGAYCSIDATLTLERCTVICCEAAVVGALAAGGGIYAKLRAHLTVHEMLLSDCRAENADGDGYAVRVPCGLALGGWRCGGVAACQIGF